MNERNFKLDKHISFGTTAWINFRSLFLIFLLSAPIGIQVCQYFICVFYTFLWVFHKMIEWYQLCSLLIFHCILGVLTVFCFFLHMLFPKICTFRFCSCCVLHSSTLWQQHIDSNLLKTFSKLCLICGILRKFHALFAHVCVGTWSSMLHYVALCAKLKSAAP